jgi:hypothetical protein
MFLWLLSSEMLKELFPGVKIICSATITVIQGLFGRE